MKLDRPASDTVMQRDVGAKLDADVATAAYGLSEVVDENMATPPACTPLKTARSSPSSR